MSADKHTPVSTAVSTASLYVRSYANRDLGIFLIFFGIVAAVPLYALIMNIVFKQAVIQWRIGIIIGLVSIILGCLLIKYSKLRFKVTRKNDGSGTISIQEGLLRSPLLYDFASGSIIKLATANTDAGSKKGELIQVTLIDGNRHYLLDSRPLNKMQESRAIAEFFSKNGSLKMLLPHYGNLMLESTDLDLPFSARVKKYPTLIGLEPTRPQNCPINTTELNGGIDRRYSWGFRANGLVFQLIALLMVAFASSCLPLFEEGDSYCSLLDYALQMKDYTYFYAASAIIGILAAVLLGIGVSVTVEGLRVNVDYKIWGIIYKQRSVLITELEEIAVKESTAGAAVLLVTDGSTVHIKVADTVLGNYLASELRHFIAKKE